MSAFDGVKVFSTTMHQDRAVLGEKVTQWLTDNAKSIEVVDVTVTQSSDSRFHMLAITVFHKRKPAAKR